MVFCTCLCLKKNAIQSMHSSSTLCRRMISSSSISRLSTCYARLYSNASAPLSLLRGNTIASPSILNTSSRLHYELSQYPISLLDRSSRQWRFMSVKRSVSAASDTTTCTRPIGFKYETNDAAPIEQLTTPTSHIQDYIQHSASLDSDSPPQSMPSNSIPVTNSHFDTTALTSLVNIGRLHDALALILHSRSAHNKGILSYPPKDRRLFFTSLGCLSSSELVTLLEPWIQEGQKADINYNRRLKQLLKYLGLNLRMDSVDHLVRCYPLDLTLQTALFHRLIKKYTACQQAKDDQGPVQLDDLLDYLDPLSNSNMEKTSGIIRTRLYNMILNSCLKLGHQDNIGKILERMVSSGCSLDVASYNMLIRSRLENGDAAAANALYDQLTNASEAPSATTATFNTFIKYACQQHLWDDMTFWLDRLLKQPDQQPNPVTLRILTAALTEHIDQPAVVDAFERVAMLVPVKSFELEATVNTSIVHLLRHKYTDVALALLYKLFDRPASEESYRLTVNSYNIFIHALSQKGDLDAADRLLVWMRDQQQQHHGNNNKQATILPPLPDIVSYTTLIHGYVRTANANDIDIDRISTLYKELMDKGLETNAVLQSVILYGMVKSGFQDMEECAKLFESMVNDGGDSDKTQVTTIMQNGYTTGDPLWRFDNNDIGSSSSRQRAMDPKMSRMTMYNMMMDGYFLHQQRQQQQQQRHEGSSSSSITTSSSSSSSSPSSININRANRMNRHIPPEPLALLNRAIENGLPLTTATLNIWVRGLALFNHDLQAAESMVKWMSLNHGVEMNERTIYYLVRAALAQDRRDKARKWISLYESMDRTIQGDGLLYLKNMVIKS